jgi:dTDP-4-amino-4,6-dideoxygalactose transaminase
MPRQGGALHAFGRWLSARIGRERREKRRSLQRDQLELGVSSLVKRVARAHDLARVVERRRRNFFHLLGALRAVAPPLVSELPPGVCPLFYPLWVPDRDEVRARLRAENVEAGEGWPTFHPRCDGEEFPETERLRQHVLELPCHQDLGPTHVAHVARSALRALSRDRPRRSRVAEG